MLSAAGIEHTGVCTGDCLLYMSSKSIASLRQRHTVAALVLTGLFAAPAGVVEQTRYFAHFMAATRISWSHWGGLNVGDTLDIVLSGSAADEGKFETAASIRLLVAPANANRTSHAEAAFPRPDRHGNRRA